MNGADILVGVHLPSKLFPRAEMMREVIVQEIVNNIEAVEIRIGSKNTIVVGDFNVNPYEDCCVNANLFFGLPVFDEIVNRKSKTIAGKTFYMFYNPMWNFLGDRSKPYGTYYHEGSDTYWSILDTVIIRPDLKERFKDDSLRILSGTNKMTLLEDNGHPDKRFSDHLPIIFEVE